MNTILLKRLRFLAISLVLSLAVLIAGTTLLVRSESGSRWLLQQAITLAPIEIQTTQISGSLADTVYIDSLQLVFPEVGIYANNIHLNLLLSNLLIGNIDIENISMTELDIRLTESNNPTNDKTESNDLQDSESDELFWLDFPVLVSIENGNIDKLLIDEAQFELLQISGNIGRNRLDIHNLDTHVHGVELQTEGRLAGPAPGQMHVTTNWQMPSENLKGSGEFNGDIDQLVFTQIIKLPDTIHFNGTLHHLFNSPEIRGNTNWKKITIPGQDDLVSKNGNFTVRSDFLSVQFNGEHHMLIQDWPQAPMQLDATADINNINIINYSLAIFDGEVNGAGSFDISNDLQGELSIDGTEINTSLIDTNLPGHINFEADLAAKSLDELELIIENATAQIHKRDFSGKGHLYLRDGQITTIDTIINNGSNRLTAQIKLGNQLNGLIKTHATDLALLWPGLQGKLDSDIQLAGTVEHPQFSISANARNLSFDSHSLDTLDIRGSLKKNNRIEGKLVATGLVTEGQHLGRVDYDINGTLAAFQSNLQLKGEIADIELRSTGSWIDDQLTQTYQYGQITPHNLDSWQLKQQTKLQLSADNGRLSAHCWIQKASSICIDDSSWHGVRLYSDIVINDFSLTTIKPLLPEGYNIDGNVNADISIRNDIPGEKDRLNWRQSRTTLHYQDNVDSFETVIDKIQLELLSDDEQTNLKAEVNSEQSLHLSASAEIDGPLQTDSPLTADIKGTLPDIELLRPFLQRVVNPGKVKGKLNIDLAANGTLDSPLFTGGFSLIEGEVQLLDAGITLTDIRLTAVSKNNDSLQLSGGFQSGKGKADISGKAYTKDDDFLAELQIQGENLASLRIPNLSLDSSPDLRLRINRDLFDIRGTIVIPRTDATIHELPEGTVSRSADVVVHDPKRTIDIEKEKQNSTIVTGEVTVILGDQVTFNGFGLNSRLDGELKLSQNRGEFLRSSGTVRVRDGFLTGYGKELRVDHGELTFTGNLDDPLINIQVSRNARYESREYLIGLRLTGSAQQVKTEPFSRPSMSENDVLSFLLLDRPASSGDSAGSATLALGLQQLSPFEGDRFGLDEVSFETNDANEAAMVAGKRINEKLFVRYVFGTSGQAGSFKIRYRLGRGFSLEASTGGEESMELIYLLER